MAVAVGYSSNKRDVESVLSEIRSQVALVDENEWQMQAYESVSGFIEYIKNQEIIDIACIDVSNDAVITVAQWIRQNRENAVIMIFADSNVSPAKYMKPSIMAAALLIKPFTRLQLKETVKELIDYFDSIIDKKEEASFVIKSKENHLYIPFNDILFFEARNKKIYLNTNKREYGFYDTMDNVISVLPDYFVRCHRSFLINSRKIDKIFLSDNMVSLHGDITVPLSKSYKSSIKELSRNVK